MVTRVFATIVVLGLAVGAFLGAAPTEGSRIPFGIFFLLIAGFVWWKWDRLKYGFDRPVMDDIGQSYWRKDGAERAKVPEADTTGRSRRD